MFEVYLPLLMLLLTIFVIARTGLLSPASIVCEFSTFSIAVFYYIVYCGGMDAPQAEGLSFAIGDYHRDALRVMCIYAALVAVTAAATLGISKKSVAASGAAGEYALELLNRFLFSSAVPIIAGVFFLLTVMHLILPLIGASNSSLMHFLGALRAPLSIIVACLLVYCWGKQRPVVMALLLFVFAYDFIFNVAFYSRFAPLSIVVATALIASKRAAAHKFPISIGVMLGSVLAIWLFLFALQGRDDRPTFDGIQAINLPLIWHYFVSIRTDSDTFVGLATNIFQGPMILAESTGDSAVAYAPKYMLLSFSPLPGFVDHWGSVQDGARFVNPVTPYNSFAELYYFGWYYVALFIVLFTLCIRTLTKIYLQIGGTAGLLMTSPCLYALLCQHQYPLRLSLRLLYFTTLLLYYVSRYINKNAETVKEDAQPDKLRLRPLSRTPAVMARTRGLSASGAYRASGLYRASAYHQARLAAFKGRQQNRNRP